MSSACPSTEQLMAALRDDLPAETDVALGTHLSECASCQARLDQLAGGSGWMSRRARTHPAASGPPPATLRRVMQELESLTTSPEAGAAGPPALDFLQPADEPGLIGHFGPYDVLEPVACGGMGIVLKARDPALNRIVAVKVLHPALAVNELARARFIREARAAAAVVHDHVVAIHAVEECRRLPYLVMAFIKGRSLAERLHAAAGPLPVEEVLRIGAQTASGLAAAHAQGLVHRDVKPANILLENSIERVKLTDFGLARAVDDSTLTQDGGAAGTPEYMSPEQADGRPVDVRSDLFSLGCVLYEMATGISPFRAERSLAALRRVCEEQPPPAQDVNPRLPDWLGQLIGRLMSKDPAGRPDSAAAVAAELERHLARWQSGATGSRGDAEFAPARPELRPALRWPARIALLTAAAAVIVIAVLIAPPSPQQPTDAAPPGPAGVTANNPGALAGNPFVVLHRDTGGESAFASLTEAVDAAPAGGVIECRFNGTQIQKAMTRITRPLILRAGPGFDPVLTCTMQRRPQPVLFAEAALVMEGLTLTAGKPPQVTNEGRRPFPSTMLLVVAKAPLRAAHCRFEIQSETESNAARIGRAIRLPNVPSARFLHCEFYTPGRSAVDWAAEPDSTTAAIHLGLEGCTLLGNLTIAGRRGTAAVRIELQGNTLCDHALLLLGTPNPWLPFEVDARRNILAADTLARAVGPAEGASLEPILRWTGRSNVYALRGDYTDTNPPLRRHDDWLASGVTEEADSAAAALGMQDRVSALTNPARAAVAAALTLTAEERAALAASVRDAGPGADPQRTGPGPAYHQWRSSPDYAAWERQMQEALNQR